MPLVNAKCTNCGANLKIDSSKDAAICEFCGSAFIVEKAVNNYSITNNNQIHANVVNIHSNQLDFEIRAGVLTKYNGSSTNVTIPDSVSIIGDGAFRDCFGLQQITIRNGISSIGVAAFMNCKSLFGITIPNSVTHIGKNAFYGCVNLKSVTLPDSVNRIESGAFCECSKLTQVKLPCGLTEIAPAQFAY